MTLRTIHESSSEEARPSHIGAVARQPGPDLTIIVYVGLALLLPEYLRTLCSCAGLFYTQVVEEQGEQVCLRIAALPHYFVHPELYERHFRTCTISYAQLDQLIEYNRSLATLATCDLRCRVAEYAAQSRRQFPVSPATIVGEMEAEEDVFVATDSALPHVSVDVAADEPERSTKTSSTRSHRRSPQLDEVQFTRTEIELPTECLQALQCLTVGDHHYRPSRRSVNITLLRTGLESLKQERKTTKSWQQKRVLKLKEQSLRQVLSGRNLVPPYLELMPVYTRGKHGQITRYQMTVDVPMLQFAA